MMGTIKTAPKKGGMWILLAGLTLAVAGNGIADEAGTDNTSGKPPMTATIKVEYDNKVGEINPLMYGGGFEDPQILNRSGLWIAKLCWLTL